MLEYDGGNLNLSGQPTDQTSVHRRQPFDPYSTTDPSNEFLLQHNEFFQFQTHLQQPSNFYVDPSPAILSLNSGGGGVMDFAVTLGLQLGRRTNMTTATDDGSSLYRRSGFRVNAPKCQAERCNADLRNAKHYHRRHKVCEFHSKAATVVAAGLSQRFCQQCSRFHLLSEFDGGKRSCRERLADHNRRRRKIYREINENNRGSKHEVETEVESPSSGVTIGISPPPPQMLDSCFGQQITPSPSTNALFLSSGMFGWSDQN